MKLGSFGHECSSAPFRAWSVLPKHPGNTYFGAQVALASAVNGKSRCPPAFDLIFGRWQACLWITGQLTTCTPSELYLFIRATSGHYAGAAQSRVDKMHHKSCKGNDVGK
jgi:hypothetical protein